jgi:hypothetical protein
VSDVDLLKSALGLFSALGAVAAYKYNMSQSQKARAELIEKFENSLHEGNKHAVCELFKMLHGLQMDYEDIQAICSSNGVVKIIRALQKTPGMVKHENGRFQYTKLFEKKWVRVLNKYTACTLAYAMGSITAILIILMAVLPGPASIAMLVLAIPGTAFLAMQLKDIRHDSMIESLINEPEK